MEDAWTGCVEGKGEVGREAGVGMIKIHCMKLSKSKRFFLKKKRVGSSFGSPAEWPALTYSLDLSWP